MKELPKEFQFKCDEHSKEQCDKLGIDVNSCEFSNIGYFYLVKKNIVRGSHNDIDIKFKDYPIINLSDYIEEEEAPDHSDLIVEMTKANAASQIASGKDVRTKYCIDLAEETIKQLKERGYLK